jgi:hypothetical protein
LAYQLDARFFWRSVAFPVVARMTTGDQIFPGGLTVPRSRDDVVERHLTRRHGSKAVLAGVPVTHQDIFAG